MRKLLEKLTVKQTAKLLKVNKTRAWRLKSGVSKSMSLKESENLIGAPFRETFEKLANCEEKLEKIAEISKNFYSWNTEIQEICKK